jgi:hypothetical protein
LCEKKKLSQVNEKTASKMAAKSIRKLIVNIDFAIFSHGFAFHYLPVHLTEEKQKETPSC